MRLNFVVKTVYIMDSIEIMENEVKSMESLDFKSTLNNERTVNI